MACCCVNIVKILEQLIQYLIRNAYIIISLDGTPFFESGQKAFKLIKNNLAHCYSVNQFGDIVLVVCRFLVTLIAFISELSFWRCELLKNDGRVIPNRGTVAHKGELGLGVPPIVTIPWSLWLIKHLWVPPNVYYFTSSICNTGGSSRCTSLCCYNVRVYFGAFLLALICKEMNNAKLKVPNESRSIWNKGLNKINVFLLQAMEAGMENLATTNMRPSFSSSSWFELPFRTGKDDPFILGALIQNEQ